MIDFKKEALEIKDEVVANRRYIHRNAEGGFDLPLTTDFVLKKLEEIGLKGEKCGKAGIVVTIGQGDKCVLLRGDMDALPMTETSDVPFASKTGFTHSCGHDCHASMLLGAAKILKAHEKELGGKVKFMFQPAEELLQGALDMIDRGLLENPHVDAAFAIHTSSGSSGSSVGRMFYSSGPALYSGDAIDIEVFGKQSHGSRACEGVDAINIAAHIVIALEEIIAREIPSDQSSVVLVGKITGGDSCNTTAGYAKLEVSVRAQTEENREFLIKRITEISESVAATYRGKAVVKHVYGIAPLVCDPTIAAIGAKAAREIGMEPVLRPVQGGTEDFTAVAAKVPAVMMNVGSGSIEEGYIHGHHNPSFKVDEDVLPLGVALYCQCAYDYLNNK